MNFPLFIAKRYIFSKKSTNAINIISGISVVGIIIATMALVVVLSVFNGFHDMVASLLTNFDPQLRIEAVKGKTMASDDPKLAQVKKLEEVQTATECVRDMALAVYEGKQQMVTLMGVDDNFEQLARVNDILYGDKKFCTHAGGLEFALPSAGVAQTLGLNMNRNMFIQIYAPTREGQLDMSDMEGGFVVDSLMLEPTVFAVGQNKYDRSYIISSIEFARTVFGLQGEMTSLDLRMAQDADIDAVKTKIKDILGNEYKVEDRFEQQADTFRIMQVEKMLAYIFLTFILVVACFSIVSSVSMLMIDKKEDAKILRNLGASDKQIRRIFLFEGRLISAMGAVIGVALGLLICWLQQEYGFVKMGQEGQYLMSAYPVSVHYLDVLVVFMTVVLVSWIAVFIPVRHVQH